MVDVHHKLLKQMHALFIIIIHCCAYNSVYVNNKYLAS